MGKKHKAFLAYSILTFMVFFVSCDTENNTPEPTKCTYSIVEVTNDITVPTVWKDCNVYLIITTRISVSSTLTIEPGALVKFTDHIFDNAITFSSTGRIKAEGTRENPLFSLLLKMTPKVAIAMQMGILPLRQEEIGVVL